MEYNKEEARKAMDIAEKKLSENDYVRAKEFVNKAQSLYPNLDGLEQMSIMIDVYISASNGGEESNWYGILGVNPLTDDEIVKKQYKKLALLLHPDKNKFNGAEEAFKLVSEAWCLLSDKDKRIAYDQRRKSKQKKKPAMPPHEPASYNKPKPANPKPKPDSSLKGTFWTMCNECYTYCEFLRAYCLNRTLPCPNCNQNFVATEIIPETINGRPVIRLRPFVKSTSKSRTGDTSSTSYNRNQAPERVKRWFEAMPETDSTSKRKKSNTFWTVCNSCKTYCRFSRASCLNKTLACPNCCQDFVATEIIPEVINGSPVIRLSANFQSTNKNTSDSTTSCCFQAERLFDGTWIHKQRKTNVRM